MYKLRLNCLHWETMSRTSGNQKLFQSIFRLGKIEDLTIDMVANLGRPEVRKSSAPEGEKWQELPSESNPRKACFRERNHNSESSRKNILIRSVSLLLFLHPYENVL